MVVESLMMAIAAIVPHFLMGIAAGAGENGRTSTTDYCSSLTSTSP